MQTTQRVSHLSDARQIASSVNIARRKTDALDLSSDQLTLTVDRNGDVTGNWNVSGYYGVGGVQVVGARDAGWTADTGTADKTSHATYTPGILLVYATTYTKSELDTTGLRIQTIENELQVLSQQVKALKDALIAHGIIGT